MDHKFKVGDKVIYTNDFGVCWGVKVITELSERTGKPVYMYEGSDTPWFHVPECNFKLAEPEDLIATIEKLQSKYGFTPTEWYGCY
ncbi:hypothetical protein HYP99_gp093 [Sinorhizobium phage ort11]|uniref:Uncharacterized protein n=1 Tax=Sinorhizobium phage ort11 TaxID=2599764 RepID=A0A5C2H268_9CAUD|nr:hypothetical protein HYP99_gp093 [Sinorhizobium phage ort11]QEP29900.1 hypothetical protein Smphiort11_102 [Sinorhizobium phage ort11]